LTMNEPQLFWWNNFVCVAIPLGRMKGGVHGLKSLTKIMLKFKLQLME
jgi:hypothetical protein